MTTLVTYGNSDGQRRCDAKCYNAIGGECDCCCGGMNHGKGEVVAMENTREHAKEMLGAFKAKGCKSAGDLLDQIEAAS